MGTGRWRIELVEEAHSLPALWHAQRRHPRPVSHPGERSGGALVAAFDLLARRGIGTGTWTASFRDDPLAFLLDSIGDAIRIWQEGGRLVYRNRAAAVLDVGRRGEAPLEVVAVGDHQLERRCMHFRHGGAEYVLEIVRELRG